MSPQVQTIIQEAEELSPNEQMELLSAISEMLQNHHKQSLTFWKPKTLEQLADEQQIQAIKNISDLKTDFWPEEESIDEFNEYIYKQREEDRLRN